MKARTDNDLPGWSFFVREVSMNVYVVTATHESGQTIEMSGTDVEQLVDECRRVAIKAESQGDQQ